MSIGDKILMTFSVLVAVCSAFMLGMHYGRLRFADRAIYEAGGGDVARDALLAKGVALSEET